MKKIFAVAALVCCSIVSFGQKQGDISLNASLNFGHYKSDFGAGGSAKDTSFGLGAGANYFVIDNLAVGLGLSYSHSGTDGQSSNGVVITPSVAYYIGICDNIYYRPTVSYSFESSNYKSSMEGIPDRKVKYNSFDLSIGAFEYRVRDHFAVITSILDFTVGKQVDSDCKTTGLALSFPSFGIIYYL